jgi:wyosine [tRNA(Phe)-imidazoG37] synthetase (radical SAM superfamily)
MMALDIRPFFGTGGMTLELSDMQSAWQSHGRRWKGNRYVYAVVSRRSRSISIGINLNPDKVCNFNCIYCQVDRRKASLIRSVNLEHLAGELDLIIAAERDGSLYEAAPFNVLRSEERGIRDLAFSGDGEPTTFARFAEAIRIAASARIRNRLSSAKLVLLTNAARLASPAAQEGLALLDRNNGEIWAKLDAGTEEYFRLVNRAHIPLSTVVDNILKAARTYRVIIQSLWLKVRGNPPHQEEIEAYCGLLNGILARGGHLQGLGRIAALVRAKVPIPTETYYGVIPG